MKELIVILEGFYFFCPQVGIKYQPPTVIPGADMAKVSRAVFMLYNTKATAEAWDRHDQKFDLIMLRGPSSTGMLGRVEEGEFSQMSRTNYQSFMTV